MLKHSLRVAQVKKSEVTEQLYSNTYVSHHKLPVIPDQVRL